MSDKIDKILDRLIKGGPGSGKRGHKSAPAPVNFDSHGNYRKEDYPHQKEEATPVSDTKREMDPDKKKKTLASDRKVARKQVKGHSPEELQSKIDSHKELSESQHLSPASRESYAAKHKALVQIQKKNKKASEISPPKKEEGVATSTPGPFGNIRKGGPGSGRKGHKTSEGASAAMSDNRRANTEKYLDQLKTSLSLETDPAAKVDFEKDIKDIEAELKANKPDEAHDLMSQMKAPGVGSMAKADWEDKIDKSLDTLFYMNQLANQGRIKPKNKRGGRIRKSITDHILEKKQGVPKGVDPAKHERCVMDVKAEGNDKSSAFAICNSSMKKGVEPRLPTDVGPEGPEDDWVVPSVTDKVPPKPSPSVTKSKDKVEKVLPIAAGKAALRIAQNAVKSPDAGKGSDKVPGGPGGPSVAAGGGTGSSRGPSAPQISKSLAERLDKMLKGGIGSGRKGHHSIGRDYSDSEHDSVFEDSAYDNTGEREAFKDKMKAAAAREEERASQRIKEKESTAERGVSRKGGKKPEKKSFLQRIGQGIIDRI